MRSTAAWGIQIDREWTKIDIDTKGDCALSPGASVRWRTRRPQRRLAQDVPNASHNDIEDIGAIEGIDEQRRLHLTRQVALCACGAFARGSLANTNLT